MRDICNELYNKSKGIYNKWKVTDGHNKELLIQSWYKYCERIGYKDPFEYVIVNQYRNKKACDIIEAHAIKNKILCKGGISDEIILPYFVESISNMFRGIRTKRLDLSSFNTSNIKIVKSAFRACRVDYIDLSSFNTSNVEDFDYMFAGIETERLDLSSFDTSNAKYMRGMFREVVTNEVNLVSFNTENVLNFDRAFMGALIDKADLRGFDFSSVRSMERMFTGAGIEEILLPNLELCNIRNTDDMFSGLAATVYLDGQEMEIEDVSRIIEEQKEKNKEREKEDVWRRWSNR